MYLISSLNAEESARAPGSVTPFFAPRWNVPRPFSLSYRAQSFFRGDAGRRGPWQARAASPRFAAPGSVAPGRSVPHRLASFLTAPRPTCVSVRSQSLLRGDARRPVPKIGSPRESNNHTIPLASSGPCPAMAPGTSHSRRSEAGSPEVRAAARVWAKLLRRPLPGRNRPPRHPGAPAPSLSLQTAGNGNPACAISTAAVGGRQHGVSTAPHHPQRQWRRRRWPLLACLYPFGAGTNHARNMTEQRR